MRRCRPCPNCCWRVPATAPPPSRTLRHARGATARAWASLSIPALSKQAMALLAEIEAVRERGGQGCLQDGLRLRGGGSPFCSRGEVNDALNACFGWSAFTDKADTVAQRNMIERMPDDLDLDRREKLNRLYHHTPLCRRTASCRKEDRSRSLPAPASCLGKR